MNNTVFLFLLLPFFGLSQNQLTISVEGVLSSEGRVLVAVYDRSDAFLSKDGVFRSGAAKAKKNITEVILEDLPKGEYALAVFHDENSNDEMDTNWLGIPKEPIGFSKAKMKMFGPPNFEECAFEVDSDTNIRLFIK